MASLVSQSRVPIAQLNPNLEGVDYSSVHGIVTLIWPYNSLTRSLSLLLVEPDFRLRRHQGQVRLQFQGSSAKALTKLGVSSGDELALSLQGASWEKDAETANTPGRGIAWKVTFGERVALETQHPGQALRVLDINHPPSSPDTSRQISSPPSSPLYNSHIPTSSGKPNLEALNDNFSTWSSPAFLKRSHFTLSSQDPFAELDEEFADNSRKKRAKFGHGSGQWKFVGTEPSPEREFDDAANREHLPSPSKAIQVDTRQEDEEMVMLATPPVEISDSKVDKISSISGAPGSSHSGNEAESKLTGVNEMDPEGLGARLDSTLGDRSPPVDEGQPVELQSGTNKTDSSTKIADQRNTPSPAAKASSTHTNSSVISSRGHSSTFDSEKNEIEGSARDSGSDAFWSEPISDYSLDGAAMSKVHQAANIAPMANEIGRRWVEMQRRISRPDATESAKQISASKASIQLRDKTENDISNMAQEPSNKPDSFTPSDPGNPMPAVAESVDATETSQNQTSDAKDDSENASLEHLEKDDTDETSLTHDTQHEDSDQATKGPDVLSLETTSVDNVIEIKGPSISAQTTQARRIVDEDRSDQENDFKTTIQESASPGDRLTKPLPDSQTLDSGVRMDEGQNEHQPTTDAAERNSEHLTRIGNDERVDIPPQTDHMAEHDQLAPKQSIVPENDVISVDSESENFSDGDIVEEKGDSTSEKGSPINADQIPDSLDLTKAFKEPVSDGDDEEDVVNAQMPSDIAAQDFATSAENLPIGLQFPSTIQDTFDDPSATFFITENDAEQTDLSTQAPEPLVASTIGDKTTPTPKLNHEITDSIVVRDTDISESFDEKPLQSQFVEDSASQEPAKIHDVRQTHASTFETETRNELAEIKPETPPSSAVSKASVAQLEDESSATRKLKESRDSNRESSLITRLKELRRRSDRMGGDRLSSSSASPWFTPRRPSLQASDEAEDEKTNFDSMSADHIREVPAKTAMKDAPEKIEMRLSQSSIHSPPPQSPQSPSTPQESQYIPNSQQATGFRTKLSYFVPVTSLHAHYGTPVDVLAVAISSTPVTRAPSGPKDHTQTIYLTDPSLTLSRNPNTLTTAQIFRPYRSKKESLECFPSIQAGDAILLREFRVQSFQKSMSLISSDSSAWAVFRKDADVSIPGPPVEYGPEERAFARGLWDWWASLEPKQSAALVAAIPKTKTSGGKKATAKKGLGFDLPSSQTKKTAKKAESSDKSNPTSMRERLTDLESSPEPENDEKAGRKAKTPEPQRRILRPRKAKDMTSSSPEKDAAPEVEEIHELRDGTRYVDREGVGVEDVEAANGVHDLRDGTRYRDRLRK